MKTATFLDINITVVKSTRKNGRDKCNWEHVEVVDNIHPVRVIFAGVEKTYYMREKDMAYAEKYRITSVNLYDGNGNTAMGMWQHGRFGMILHPGRLSVWLESRQIIEAETYQNGRVKDSNKYLIRLI